MISAYLKRKQYKKAKKLFEEVKKYKDIVGMMITYNCALNIYLNLGEV